MRLMLYPTDAAFAQNIAELAAAVKEKRPYAPHHFEVHLGDQRLETPSVRLYGEFIYLLGADLIREARLEIKDVSVVVAHFQPRSVMAILGRRCKPRNHQSSHLHPTPIAVMPNSPRCSTLKNSALKPPTSTNFYLVFATASIGTS